jgi:hypothetical protein
MHHWMSPASGADPLSGLVDNASLDVAKLCGRSRHRVVSVKRGDLAVTTQCASATGRDQ